jgi:glucosamine--fructose-6-phosphate aminotransferase (isomerizing)
VNLHEEKYTGFALVKEMLETVEIVRNFQTKDLSAVVKAVQETGKLFLTGEGSSRIFPAKNAINIAQKNALPLTIYTEGSRQAAELDLSKFVLFGASNSGKTKEVISLFQSCHAAKKYALTAFSQTPLGKLSDDEFILNCGKERAIAATKSVIEQALFYHQLLSNLMGREINYKTLNILANFARQILEMEINPEITSQIKNARIIYFAGRNVGPAEEATLKANEILRKKSVYLEGTYAVHGIEEAMEAGEIVILVDPFPEEEEIFKEVLVAKVGMNAIAISSHKTIFPTIEIPSLDDFNYYLQLLACWNILIEVGIAARMNLDKTVRARKVGNEYIS